MKKISLKRRVWLLVILAVLVLAALVIWIVRMGQQSIQAVTVGTSNWQTFTSNLTGYKNSLADVSSSFSFQYPPGWTISYNSNPRAILTLFDPAISEGIGQCKEKNMECPADTGIDLFGVTYATSSDTFFTQNYPDYQAMNVNGLDVFEYQPNGNPVNVYHINFPDNKEAVEFYLENIINADYAQELPQIIKTFQILHAGNS